MAFSHQSFRDLGGEFLARRQDCPGQGVQAGEIFLHPFLQGIQPDIEALM
jgi:hypothetical protein